MAYNLLLDYYKSEEVNPAVFTGRVYCLVLDRSHQAINFSIAAPYQFSAYLKSLHTAFVRPLPQHAQRTKYYYDLVSADDLDIPDCPYGEQYITEIWAEQVSGSPNRDNDYLLQTKDFIWVSGYLSEHRISVKQEDDIIDGIFSKMISGVYTDLETFGGMVNSIYEKTSNLPDDPASAVWVCHFAVAYDHSQSILRIAAWLERNGEKYSDSTNLEVIIIDSSETEIINASDSNFIASGEFQGVIFKQFPTITLNPDETYAAVIKITDGETPPVEHISGAAPITWD